MVNEASDTHEPNYHLASDTSYQIGARAKGGVARGRMEQCGSAPAWHTLVNGQERFRTSPEISLSIKQLSTSSRRGILAKMVSSMSIR